jgi:hypothetical protein
MSTARTSKSACRASFCDNTRSNRHLTALHFDSRNFIECGEKSMTPSMLSTRSLFTACTAVAAGILSWPLVGCERDAHNHEDGPAETGTLATGSADTSSDTQFDESQDSGVGDSQSTASTAHDATDEIDEILEDSNEPDLIADDFDFCESQGIEDCPRSFVKDDLLHYTIAYSVGCAPHTFTTYWDKVWLESLPPQVRLVVYHDAHGETCEASLFDERVVDVKRFRESLEAAGNGANGIDIRVMNAHDPDGASLKVHYSFD